MLLLLIIAIVIGSPNLINYNNDGGAIQERMDGRCSS